MRFSRIQINNFYNLKDVNLDLSSGSALIVGPNGSGKSNIIKCVEGLVKLLTDDVKFGSGTWSEGPDKTFIKIQARLSRIEAEIMCRLHAVFVTCDVILVANMISQLIFDMWRESLQPLDSAEKAVVLNSIIPSGVSDTLRNHVVSMAFREHVSGSVDINEVISKKRILQICIEELYLALHYCEKQENGFFNSDVDWVELFATPMPRRAADIDKDGQNRTDFLKVLSFEDESERQQFMKIKEAFKALSGLDIEAVQQHRVNVLLEEQLIAESESLSSKVDEYRQKSMTGEVGAAAYEIGIQFKRKGDHLMKLAPRGLRYVGLVATRTLDGEGGTKRSIRVPLLDCSGGEKECLMVLTAIQWPTADTVFLDEPGHSLHPPQQAQLRRFLETQRRPDQAIVTVTHAVEFISTVSLKSLYHMSCTGLGFTPFKLVVHEETVALDGRPRALPSFPTEVSVDQNVMNMLMGPDMRKVFFATGLYFVEGETDKKVLNSLRYYMLEHARVIRDGSSNICDLCEAQKILEMDSWDILALGGCGNAVKAYKAAKALMIPCAVILDEDTITVKHGKRLEPFTQTNWEKSNLCRELKANERSLDVASEILCKLKSAFEDSEQEEMHEKARQILEEYGFWIWNGDLEGIIFDNKDARQHIMKLHEFISVVLPNELASQLQVGSRAIMPLEAALDNFDHKLRDPLELLLDELQNELAASRDAKRDAYSEDSTFPVTEKLQDVLERIGKFKQIAINYDKFCKKGTKRKLDSGEPLKKKFAKSSEEDSSLVQTREKAFWKRVKEQLHDHGGWMKIPDEMMQKIIAACLNDGFESDNPLARFSKFMKWHQYRGKPEKKRLPEDIVSRILANATSR